MDRCLQFETPKPKESTLDGAFEALTIRSSHASHATPLFIGHEREQSALNNIYLHDLKQSKEISVIVQAMRKLREAIVAVGRIDDFAQSVYIFVIRATILLGQVESYHPALLHLLRRIHPKNSLSQKVFQEMLGYQILDLACRQQDLNEAYRISLAYRVYDPSMRNILESLACGNWVAFWKIKSVADRYQQRLMDQASDRMRKHVVGCLGKSYLSVERCYIEKAAQSPWESLVQEHTIRWRLEGENVIVRQIKRK